MKNVMIIALALAGVVRAVRSDPDTCRATSCDGSDGAASAAVRAGGNTAVPELESGRITPERFAASSLATMGTPLVVRGAARGWLGMRLWSSLASLKASFGEQIQNRMPEAGEPMFGDDGEFVGRFDEEVQVRTYAGDGTADHISWLVLNETASAQLKQGYGSNSILSTEDTLSGPEYFFVGRASGQGREPHIDYDCASTWSAQIQGRKRWRLWPPDSGVLGFESSTSSSEEDVFDASTPGFEAVLEPGDLIIWHAGWTHATDSLAEENVAMSKQFTHPAPTEMFRTYARQFRVHTAKFNSFTSCAYEDTD